MKVWLVLGFLLSINTMSALGHSQTGLDPQEQKTFHRLRKASDDLKQVSDKLSADKALYNNLNCVRFDCPDLDNRITRETRSVYVAGNNFDRACGKAAKKHLYAEMQTLGCSYK